MRVVAAAVIVAFMAVPAFGQDKQVPRYGETPKDKTIEEKQAERDAEKAYRRSLGNIPDTQKPVDPWGNVRSDSTPKPETKAPAKKTKTGTTSN